MAEAGARRSAQASPLADSVVFSKVKARLGGNVRLVASGRCAAALHGLAASANILSTFHPSTACLAHARHMQLTSHAADIPCSCHPRQGCVQPVPMDEI
jgi:hypothetical protein